MSLKWLPVRGRMGRAPERGILGFNMASVSTADLRECDIPGSSLEGRKPSLLKNDELRFWLRCRGDNGKGLRTKAQLVQR